MTSFRQLRHTYQHMVISIVVIVFCSVGYFGGVYPAAQKITNLFQQRRILLEQRDLLKKKLEVLNSLDEESLRSDLAIVLTAVPSDKSVPMLFRTVEGVANQSGVSIGDISVSEVGTVASRSAQAAGQTSQEKQIGSHLTPFVVNILGNFENIQQYISIVPTVRRLMRIRTFAMQFPKEDKPLQVSIEMDTFYEPFPTVLGDASLPISDLTPMERQTLEQVELFPIIATTTNQVEPLEMNKANPFSH